VIISARITNITVRTKGKGEDVVRVGKITIEADDLDDWQMDAISEMLDGVRHKIGIDE
jgi:hypothetical protein